MVLAVTDSGAVWCFWVATGGGGDTNYRLYGITDDNFNGSTLAWSSKSTMATAYDPYFYGIDGFYNSEHDNRVVLFGENYNDQPLYVAFETTSVVTNVTDRNVIGFSNSAISDGATGTINIQGSIATGLSGLTPATIYYVQDNGTLGTSVVSTQASVLALGSDKGMIQTRVR